MRRYILLTVLILSAVQTFAQSTKDTLLIAYAPSSPFIINENDQLEGISIWLWENCAKELDLNYKIIQMPLGTMLDSVKTGGIDLSINPLTITSDRLKDMKFPHTFYASHSVVAKDHISAFKRVINFLKSLFSFNFLSAFLALMILIGIFGFLVWHFENKVNPQNFRTGYKGIWDGLWWAVVTMTTVGYGDKTPKSRGGKIVALVWMFSGLLFISGLTASVASTLTVDQLTAQTSNFEDFKDRKIGTIQRSSSEQYLKDNFFKNVQRFENVPSGLDALANHELEAFVYDEPIVKYQIKNEDRYSNLEVLPTKFKVQFYAFALSQKHDTLRNLLSQKIMDITERNEWQVVLNEYGCGEQ